MVRFATHCIAIASLITLSACFLTSDSEIIERITLTFPEKINLKISNIEKSVDCIAAKFFFSESFDVKIFDQQSRDLSKSVLGESWDLKKSVYEYVESIENYRIKSTLEGTIVHAKPCMQKISFSIYHLYDEPIALTKSKSGKEMVIIFYEKSPKLGIYLAQGR